MTQEQADKLLEVLGEIRNALRGGQHLDLRQPAKTGALRDAALSQYLEITASSATLLKDGVSAALEQAAPPRADGATEALAAVPSLVHPQD